MGKRWALPIFGQRVFMMCKAIIHLVIALVVYSARADDLDVIVDTKVSAEDRGQAYQRLLSADFPTIAAKLATLEGTHPIFTGIGPRTKQPWFETQLSEGDRIGCTLSQLWQYHVNAVKSREQNINLMLTLLEDPSVGQGRQRVIGELSALLHFGRQLSDISPSSLDTTLSHLDRFARDSKQPNFFRQQIVKILGEHGDPNLYLDLAIELSAAEDTPRKQANAFCLCTSGHQTAKFTEANRKKYVRHCFELLENVDDGSGYFLAMQVGKDLGIPPVRPTEGSFAPDPQLAQYRDKNGNITENFFHDTVINARKWWEENKSQY